ncbi:MAG: DNA alkylation repair protein [Candidatus Margulisbacteria bacterium]|nr:DNA alkylation repair protein [Candidatus Margulisiibacteriota bacterium]
MNKKIQLKDTLFNKEKVEKISGEIHKVYPSFNSNDFVQDVITKFPELELKARISWITNVLYRYLPNDYLEAISILLDALPDPNDPALSDNDFGDFIYAPYGEYVAQYGCTKKYLRHSLNALYKITKRFSAEDAIRYFLNAFPKETLNALLIWSTDSHYHVRRLASEGARPKLPWSQKIHISISEPLQLLDNLFSDNTRYVTRSVANHMNDISKIDPDLVINTLSKWKRSLKQTPKEINYIIHHALRTLVKQGNPKAMELMGFSPSPKVILSEFVIPKEVILNTTLNFSFLISSKDDLNVIIDYIIYFQNKLGKLSSKKVFKLSKRSLKRNVPVLITKSHKLIEKMTTRTLYPGNHELGIQVNGKRIVKKMFYVKKL